MTSPSVGSKNTWRKCKMSFIAQIIAYVLQWLLTLGGKAMYEAVTEFVEKQKQKKKEKENLDKLHEAEKKGNRDAILDKERDLLNGE